MAESMKETKPKRSFIGGFFRFLRNLILLAVGLVVAAGVIGGVVQAVQKQNARQAPGGSDNTSANTASNANTEVASSDSGGRLELQCQSTTGRVFRLEIDMAKRMVIFHGFDGQTKVYTNGVKDGDAVYYVRSTSNAIEFGDIYLGEQDNDYHLDRYTGTLTIDGASAECQPGSGGKQF